MLRNYETMYIIRPTLDDEAVENVAKKVDEQIAGIGGTVEKTEKRGRKRLSYEVKDFKEGFYILTDFQVDPSQITELERLFRLNDDVIRHIVVRKEEVKA